MGMRRGSLGMKIHMALGVNHRIYGSIPKGIRVELTVLLASWSGGPWTKRRLYIDPKAKEAFVSLIFVLKA